jgi:DNA-directed RNA polymerase subunit RPC12/RpoP
MRDNENMIGQGFHPGPQYFYKCLKCGHLFSENRQIFIFCPKCKSLKIVKDFKIVK